MGLSIYIPEENKYASETGSPDNFGTKAIAYYGFRPTAPGLFVFALPSASLRNPIKIQNPSFHLSHGGQVPFITGTVGLVL